MTRRRERLNDLLREVIAEIVRRDLKDPRLDVDLLSITEVQVSPDLRHARVHISVLGDDAARAAALDALNRSRHFIHRQLAPRLDLKHVPEMRFVRDDRLEQDQAMLNLIRDVRAQDDGPAPEREPA